MRLAALLLAAAFWSAAIVMSYVEGHRLVAFIGSGLGAMAAVAIMDES